MTRPDSTAPTAPTPSACTRTATTGATSAPVASTLDRTDAASWLGTVHPTSLPRFDLAPGLVPIPPRGAGRRRNDGSNVDRGVSNAQRRARLLDIIDQALEVICDGDDGEDDSIGWDSSRNSSTGAADDSASLSSASGEADAVAVVVPSSAASSSRSGGGKPGRGHKRRRGRYGDEGPALQ